MGTNGGILMWQKKLERLLADNRRLGDEDFREVAVPRLGVSQADVVILSGREGRFYALKTAPNRSPHSIPRQMDRRGRLVQLYGERHLPEVVASNHEAMLMAYAGDSLSWMVSQQRLTVDDLSRRIAAIYGKVEVAWVGNKRPCQAADIRRHRLARDPLQRWQRVRAGILGQSIHGIDLAKHRDKVIVVNGVVLPSLATLLARAPKAYRPPRFAVYCHGDMTGENLLVERSETNGWQLIDWEWVGWHDWRVAASFMGEWWWANHATIQDASIRVVGKRLLVDFKVAVPLAIEKIRERGQEFAARIGKAFGEAGTWQEQLRLQEAILTLGDMRFVTQRQKPAELSIALLGRGTEILHSVLFPQ